MNKRKEILERALFDTGGEVSGVKFGPLSPPVFIILKRRKNVLVLDGSTREQDETEALGEILFVLSRTPQERAAMFRTGDAAWNDAVLEFIAGLDDTALAEFSEHYLGPAFKAVQMAQTESEGSGKSGAARSPVTSRSSTKEQAKSDSTTSPARSARKIPSGTSASPQSSNSSSRTQSGKGTATAGSSGRNHRKS